MEMVAEPTETTSSFTFFLPWLVCITSSLFFFYEFIQGNMFASIADNIMSDFQIQADKMAYLSSIYYLSTVVFLFVAGMVLDRYSPKKTMMFTMFLCVASTFVLAYTHSYALALVCRFMMGIGSAFCFLGPVRLASRWFSPKRMAMVTGVIVTFAMTGGMVAQYPLTKLVNQIGWRDALAQVGWLGVFLLVIMQWGIRDKAQNGFQAARKKISLWLIAKKAYFNTQHLRAAFYTSLMNMAIAVFGAMMGSLYLMQRMSISKEEAAIINSMLFLGAILGGPVLGWISDKLSLRVLPMKVCGLISLVVFLAVLYLPVSITLMKGLFFLLGFFTAAQVISYALVAETCSPIITATALSLISILTQGGYIVYQNLFSRLLISHGEGQLINGIPSYTLHDYQFAAIMLPIGLVLAIAAAWGLKEPYAKNHE